MKEDEGMRKRTKALESGPTEGRSAGRGRVDPPAVGVDQPGRCFDPGLDDDGDDDMLGRRR